MTKEEIQKNSEHWYNKYKDAEKRIEELENQNRLLGERCNQLLNDKGDLTDQIADIKANCDLAIEGRDIKIKELEEQSDKWFVYETDAGNWGMDKATQYTVDRHNYFYGTKEECQKWGVEHKIKDYTGHKYCYDRLEEQLTKARELLNGFMRISKASDEVFEHDYSELIGATEQFLKEIEK